MRHGQLRDGTESDMRGAQFLADGHHVDEAGNLISCTYVDLRDPLDRTPITTLNKASFKRYAIPGCETIRLSKPSCFLDQGEGLIGSGEDRHASTNNGPDGAAGAGAGTDAVGEAHYGTNAWIYCASLEPETEAERAAWRAAMPCSYDAVSPIRRPREFARALGAMAAEQAGPRGRTVLLRNTVDGRAFCTAHRSQTIYHGPVIYPDDAYRRLERASSDLELLLLLVFMKHPAQRGQREYRFAVWTEAEPAEDWVDLRVSLALLEAMRTERPEPEGRGFVSAGVEESSTLEEIGGPGSSGMRLRIEARPAFARGGPTVGPQHCAVERLSGDVSETAAADATVRTLRAAVGGVEAARQKEAAAAAWHAEPVIRFLCAMLGDGIASLCVSEDGFIVTTAEVAGDDLVELSIAVGPEGTCGCRISVGDRHLASTAADAGSFQQALKKRLREVGLLTQDSDL